MRNKSKPYQSIRKRKFEEQQWGITACNTRTVKEEKKNKISCKGFQTPDLKLKKIDELLMCYTYIDTTDILQMHISKYVSK